MHAGGGSRRWRRQRRGHGVVAEVSIHSQILRQLRRLIRLCTRLFPARDLSITRIGLRCSLHSGGHGPLAKQHRGIVPRGLGVVQGALRAVVQAHRRLRRALARRWGVLLVQALDVQGGHTLWDRQETQQRLRGLVARGLCWSIHLHVHQQCEILTVTPTTHPFRAFPKALLLSEAVPCLASYATPPVHIHVRTLARHVFLGLLLLEERSRFLFCTLGHRPGAAGRWTGLGRGLRLGLGNLGMMRRGQALRTNVLLACLAEPTLPMVRILAILAHKPLFPVLRRILCSEFHLPLAGCTGLVVTRQIHRLRGLHGDVMRLSSLFHDHHRRPIDCRRSLEKRLVRGARGGEQVPRGLGRAPVTGQRNTLDFARHL
mmetsp:Transcript_63794/g.170922  ORF Transcript_63794/g.170922 Transcript_63794/m.170922 type:complete len:373 (-) Transcript_63794:593-1711(-)